MVASVCLSSSAALAAATPCADLQIANVAFSPLEPVQGEPANIAITIKNAGTCAAGGFVTQFKTSIFSPTGPSDSVTGLAAGASTTLTLPFNFPTAGNFETVIEVDTGNAVAETNESNNLQIASVTVLPPGVNLVINRFTVTPVASNPTNAVVQGRLATAMIEIQNTGNVAAGPFVVQWTPFLGAQPLTVPVSGLGADATTTVTLNFTFPFAGTVTGSAVVDSTNQVKETDEFDNSQFLTTVVEPPLPNLTVAKGGVVVHPAPAGSQSSVDITVVNNGNDDAGSFVVRWQPWAFAAPLAQQVTGLAEGAKTTVSFPYAFPFAGTFNGTVTVDSTNAVREVSETDNTAPTTLTIPVATVDLTVTGLSIAPSSPTQGAKATVTVTVKNLGNSPSGSFVTSWNPDSLGIIVPSVQTLTQQTGPLGPGESRDLTFTFVYPRAGNFRSIAFVDAFSQVAETNEANNQRILNITAQPAPIDLVFTGPIAFSPAQPVANEAATATTVIRNNGPIATGPFAVEFTPRAGALPQFKSIDGLNPGETRTLTFDVTYPAGGSFTATAVIDPFNQVVEPGPGAKANNTINQGVTVVVRKMRLTLNSLNVLTDLDPTGDAEWNPMYFLVFDPSGKCQVDLTPAILDAKPFDLPLVSCARFGSNDVSKGTWNLSGVSLTVSLNHVLPLVAAVTGLEDDNACLPVIGCTQVPPDFPGFATFTASPPDYANAVGDHTLAGQKCNKDDGHCFDAFLHIDSIVGPASAADISSTAFRGHSAVATSARARSSVAAHWTVRRERAYLMTIASEIHGCAVSASRHATAAIRRAGLRSCRALRALAHN